MKQKRVDKHAFINSFEIFFLTFFKHGADTGVGENF